MGEVVTHKEIIGAILGASSSLASILLVFVGFLMSRADSFPSSTPDDIIKRYANLAKGGVPLVLGCLALMFTSFLWLLDPAKEVLYHASVIGFLVITLGIGLYVLAAVFWRG